MPEAEHFRLIVLSASMIDALIFLAVLILGILIQSRCRNSRYRT